MAANMTDLFYDYGKSFTKHASFPKYVGMSRFKAFFGVSPSICAKAWFHIKNDLPPDDNEMHLLWALFFLKCYNTDSVNCSAALCDEKTFRKRNWVVVEKLAFMKMVRYLKLLFRDSCKCMVI